MTARTLSRHTCLRCRSGEHDRKTRRCSYCGSTDRYPVRKRRRQRPIGGKRGRNSGTVGTAKTKK